MLTLRPCWRRPISTTMDTYAHELLFLWLDTTCYARLRRLTGSDEVMTWSIGELRGVRAHLEAVVRRGEQRCRDTGGDEHASRYIQCCSLLDSLVLTLSYCTLSVHTFALTIYVRNTHSHIRKSSLNCTCSIRPYVSEPKVLTLVAGLHALLTSLREVLEELKTKPARRNLIGHAMCSVLYCTTYEL